MKHRIIILSLALLSIATCFQSCTAPKGFGGLLIEFESNIGWDAVSPQWRDRRNGWIVDVQAAKETDEKAKLMMELESNVLWTAVIPDWEMERQNWIQNCKNASDERELGICLVKFESYVNWQAVADKWKDRRSSWIKDCQQL